ncbi:MAG TPA: cupin domain-containing protein [Gemmatimonadota bacterium]|nr:cupin domain-containing protein [Gemmatimonadota bacterium]
MSLHDEGFALLLPDDQTWRVSNIMKIPNADLLRDLGGSQHLGGRLWRFPPYSAGTWHRHIDSWELYFLLEGRGRMRVGEDTITVPRYGCVLVAPRMLRQVFNDSPDEALWLIVAAPQESGELDLSRIYPQDPKSLPPELAGKAWPPE